MNCPIGLSQVGGKHPMEVAVSVAAQVINCYQSKQDENDQQTCTTSALLQQKQNSRPTSQQGIHWKEFKQLLSVD
jgi:xanthine dehydrogenase accessory factor